MKLKLDGYKDVEIVNKKLQAILKQKEQDLVQLQQTVEMEKTKRQESIQVIQIFHNLSLTKTKNKSTFNFSFFSDKRS